ncbi:heme-binding protein [Mycobacterium sp. Y57]|uniref:heme-binding protein n=1 Tax=Mycolicibacterium xanthum TaxID=2796469 RepID=UPI001C84A878|nr:heme-binding protein [Mycolicibacterium xanthum]MBX7434144.1 heme-binding protein [Mycolicibacterium xanthum]
MSFVVRTAAAAAVAGAALLGSTATAAAAPPNCSLADMSGVLSGVSAAMSAYLFTHPDVNAQLSTMSDMPKEDRSDWMHTYMSDNPSVEADLTGIRQPLVDFRARCGMEPVNLGG